jgi:hypothetical protein
VDTWNGRPGWCANLLHDLSPVELAQLLNGLAALHNLWGELNAKDWALDVLGPCSQHIAVTFNWMNDNQWNCVRGQFNVIESLDNSGWHCVIEEFWNDCCWAFS